MDAPLTRVPEENPNEAGSLASELTHAYMQMTGFHRDQMHLGAGEADRAARGLNQTPDEALTDLIRIRERAPDQVSWGDLQRLVNYDPHEMTAARAQLRSEAREELASGHRTARALEWNGRPFDRARFLAIRDSFRETTPPQSGIEAALVETAAAAYSDFLQRTEQVHLQEASEVACERDSLERHGSWSPARLSAAQAIEQSAKMAEQAHSRFLRTVKMLHEWQRSSPALYVGTAAQINVGQQQVNVAPPTRMRKRPVDLPKSTATIHRRRVRPRRQAVDAGKA